jgi:hypothetical protein
LPNTPLGWAEIRHPFHPRKGQSYLILKERRVGGVDTLILRDAESGSFAVAKEWTDRATPCSGGSIGMTAVYFEVDSLFDLITLMEQLTRRPKKDLVK